MNHGHCPFTEMGIHSKQPYGGRRVSAPEPPRSGSVVYHLRSRSRRERDAAFARVSRAEFEAWLELSQEASGFTNASGDSSWLVRVEPSVLQERGEQYLRRRRSYEASDPE